MKAVTFCLSLIFINAQAWLDYDEDYMANWEVRPVVQQTVPQQQTNVVLVAPETATNSEVTRHELIADRIVDELMNMANGNIVLVISGLERRLNVRVNVRDTLSGRLTTVASAANARLTSLGFENYRPVLDAVVVRLEAQITLIGNGRQQQQVVITAPVNVNVNGRIPQGAAQRVSWTRPTGRVQVVGGSRGNAANGRSVQEEQEPEPLNEQEKLAELVIESILLDIKPPETLPTPETQVPTTPSQ